MNLFYQPGIPQGTYHLDSDESRHCVKVLRKTKGDSIRITDGRGKFYDAIITDPNPSSCAFQVMAEMPEPVREERIHIAIAPTKNADRIEWFVEKAVELGVDKITFLETENSERVFLKLERLQRVAVSAMKQSIKATLPVLQGMISLTRFMEETDEQQRFIAYVDATNPDHLHQLAKPALSTVVAIGPEGDFTPSEIAAASTRGFIKVSLGKSRLRTETAGMAACHVLNLINI